MFVEHNTSRAQITDCQSPTHKITRLSLGNVIARACKTLLSYMEAQSWCLASHLALNLWGELRHLHPTHVTDVPWLFTSVPPRCLDVPREVLSFQSLGATSNPREQERHRVPGTLRSASLFSQGATKQPRFQGVAGKRIFAPSIARRNLGSAPQRLQLARKMSPKKSWTPSPGKAQ